MRNLATSLVLHERIETTLPKAKELRRLAEHLVTLAKRGTLHARRQAAAIVQDSDAVKKLFNDGLGARFKDRPGGYTRIFKFGFRLGDGAPMAAIEYLGYQPPVREDKKQGRKETQDGSKEKKSSKKKVSKKKDGKEKKVDKKKDKKKSLFGRRDKKS